METYTINNNLYFEAWGFETKHNWGHKARAVYQGREVAEVKIVYQNRSWESYKYQSVMEKLIDAMDECKTIPLADRYQASKVIKAGDGREMKGLAMMGALAKLGGIIGGNTTKARILSTIPGVIMPEGFESLSEAEKSSRLDGAINILTN